MSATRDSTGGIGSELRSMNGFSKRSSVDANESAIRGDTAPRHTAAAEAALSDAEPQWSRRCENVTTEPAAHGRA